MLALLLLLSAPPRVAFVAGPPDLKPKPGEHEYHAGCQVLAGLVRQSGLTAAIYTDGWPTDPAALDGAAAVVLFVEGGAKNLVAAGDRLARLERLADAGTGLVFLHSAIDFDASHADAVQRLAGGVWLKSGGKRGHWVATFKEFPPHEVFRGVTPFVIDDGWLWNNRLSAAAVPLLRTVGPKDGGQTTDKGATVSWAYERPADSSRAFVFTGGHLHESLAKEGYRRFLTNGILWAARQPVPPDGAPVKLHPSDLSRHLAPVSPRPER